MYVELCHPFSIILVVLRRMLFVLNLALKSFETNGQFLSKGHAALFQHDGRLACLAHIVPGYTLITLYKVLVNKNAAKYH